MKFFVSILGNNSYFYKKSLRYFDTIFLEQAEAFLSQLDRKTAGKVIYNIDLAEQTNDPRLFKKLNDTIWEFRTRYLGQQIRMLAFWDKLDNRQTLVVATHGFFKKVDKVPANEIERAEKIRIQYFKSKSNK